MPPKVATRPVASTTTARRLVGGPSSTRSRAGRPGSAKGRVRSASSASSSSRGMSSAKVDSDVTPDDSLNATSSSDVDGTLPDDVTLASTHATDDELDATQPLHLTAETQASKPCPPTRPPRTLFSPHTIPPTSLLSPSSGGGGGGDEEVSAESDHHSDVSFEDARPGDDSLAIITCATLEPNSLKHVAERESLSAKHMQELQKHLGFENNNQHDVGGKRFKAVTLASEQPQEETATPAAVVEELPTPKRSSLLSNSRPISPETNVAVVQPALPVKEAVGLVAVSSIAPPPPLPKRSPSETTPSLILQPPDACEATPIPVSKGDDDSSTLASPVVDLPSSSGQRISIWQRLRTASVSVDTQASASPCSTSPATTPQGSALTTPPIQDASLGLASSSAGGTTTAAMGREKPSISRRPTFGALSSFSSLAAAAAAGLSAQAANVRTAYAGTHTTSERPVERLRLPRLHVDEAKLAEDVMRFAHARDVLHTERNVETLRELGQRLEEAWREKLRETHTLRERLEQAQHSLYDVEDENKHLRSSVSGLSEQIATLEATFHSFQLSTVEQMRMEKELWNQERQEALDIMRYEAAQARRELEAAKAVNAQLRLVVIGAFKHTGAANELQSIDAKLGMLGRSGLGSPVEVGRRQRTDSRGSGRGNARRSSTLASVASDDENDSSERGLGLSPGLTSPGGTREDGLLFELPASPDSGRPTTMLFDHPVPLAHLKLLGLVPDETTPPSTAMSDSPQQGMQPVSPGTPTPTPPHSAGPNLLSRSSTSTSLVSHLAAQKSAADEAHARALRDENEALRARLRDTTRCLAETEHECQELRLQVKNTEEAVSGLFDPIHL